MKVNIRTLCDLTNMGHRRISRLLKDIKPLEDSDRRSIYYESNEVLPLIYLNKSGNDEDIDLSHEKAMLARSQRLRYDLQNEITLKNLLPIDHIREVWGRIVTAAKTQFLALPDRLSQMLETCDDFATRRALIDAEVKLILNSLSQGDLEKK
jgi:hypothetical protein